MAKRKYKKKTVRRRKSVKKVSKSLRNAVQKIVARNIETKHNDFTTAVGGVYNTITATEVYNLIPDITQGTGQSNRTGNRVNPKKLKIKIALTAANASSIYAGASPTYFDIYIFKAKFSQQEGGTPQNVDMALFLQNDNSATSYNGGVTAGLRPVNSDMFTLCKRKRVVLSNLSSTVANAPYQTYNPNRTISFDLTKHVKKTWIYDDNSSLLTNDNLYIAIGATQTDGQSLGASSVGSYQFLTFCEFKDG